MYIYISGKETYFHSLKTTDDRFHAQTGCILTAVEEQTLTEGRGPWARSITLMKSPSCLMSSERGNSKTVSPGGRGAGAIHFMLKISLPCVTRASITHV